MKIIFKGIDGSVAIMDIVPGADKEEAIRKFREAHKEDFYSDPIEVGRVLKEPSDRLYRDAWTLDKKNNLIVDKEKARKIDLDIIRKDRNKKLEELDLEMLKNFSNKERIQEIEEEKQALRDLPALS